MTEEPKPTQEDVNEYLDRLKESGKVNMFGAAPFLEAMFPLTKQEALNMWAIWTETYK